MADDFQYDVFLSHSSKDKTIVRAVAERLRADGLRVWFDEWILKPGDSIPAKIKEGLEQSCVLVLCMSANAFGSDWAQLEAGTFRFRDPLNQERRFILLRLDAAPIKGSLAQFLYINWLPEVREQEYAKLFEACRPTTKPPAAEVEVARRQVAEKAIQLDYKDANIWSFAFSPDGKRAITGADDATARLWEVETGRCLRVLKGHTAQIFSIAWSKDQLRALSCGDDETVRLWDVETGRCLRVLEGHTGTVRSVAWDISGRRAVSGSEDRTVRLWDVKTGRCLHVLEGHKHHVRSVAWGTDQRALSGSNDNTVRLWDAETGRCLRVFKGHTDFVNGVEWSADQHHAISGSVDKTVRLWEVETGRCLRVLEGHIGNIWSVAWSRDQRHALSGSGDKTVRLWDVESGLCLRVLKGHANGVNSVAWSRDGQQAISGDSKGILRVWNLSKLAAKPRELTLNAEAGKFSVQGPPVNLTVGTQQVQYTNAKVLLVGDTSSGKTGLAHRLATGEWQPSDGSTVGAWSTQWSLPDVSTAQKVEELEREIWLWDFGGQADQRLVHQLYMDRTALILLLFDADKEDVLPGLREWQTALRRCVPPETPLVLVAGRIDAGFRASRAKLQQFAQEQGFRFSRRAPRTARIVTN